jgi:hypothetical protein
MAGRLCAKGFFVALVLVLLVGAASTPICHADAGTDRLRSDSNCWFGPIPEGTDPCGLLSQARDLLGRLPKPVENDVHELAAGLDIERSLGIQQRLLREHLAWLDDGLTEKQLDLMVFLAVALSLDRAQGKTIELHQALEEKAESKIEQSLRNVELYRTQALSLLTELGRGLKDISNRETRMRL